MNVTTNCLGSDGIPRTIVRLQACWHRICGADGDSELVLCTLQTVPDFGTVTSHCTRCTFNCIPASTALLRLWFLFGVGAVNTDYTTAGRFTIPSRSFGECCRWFLCATILQDTTWCHTRRLSDIVISQVEEKCK